MEDSFAHELDGSIEESEYFATYQPEDHAYAEPVPELKKRSRSPMKKMFGDGGWLGRSPSELNNIPIPSIDAPAEKREAQPAKMNIMSRIKQKLDKVVSIQYLVGSI